MSIEIPLFHVDAFTDRVFSGNPAAVCPLEHWLNDTQLQSIAAENHLSETAFFVRKNGHYELRWFTPNMEIDLCGHATLASAFVILNYVNPSIDSVNFKTKSGDLSVIRKGEYLSMDFPSREPNPCAPPEDLIKALGIRPREVLVSRDYMAVYDTEDEIKALEPDMTILQKLDRFGIIVTSSARDVDFVSRFFAPQAGIQEDPVTGSAHCTLIPYWSKKLSKTSLHALQLSPRGGKLFCEYHGDRVVISGRSALYSKGTIFIRHLSN